MSLPRACLLAVSLLAAMVTPLLALKAEVLRATGGLPPEIVGQFRDAVVVQQSKAGQYYVFDVRAHSVYTVDSGATAARKIVDIGEEEGRIIQPGAFDMEPGGTFVVADAPNRRERIQIFNSQGQRVGGFTLPGRSSDRITLGERVLNGVGSLQYTGRSLLINEPERGTLITEYGLWGTPVRVFGELRATGHEDDRDVHLALNIGLPLVDPTGGFYFVFQAGEPMFRKYDRTGNLVFERHAQGREIDAYVRALPQRWPRRSTGDQPELPLIPPTIRTAAVDPSGNLWIAFMVPYTYVYDSDGDKIRTVQFQAAGIVTPTSFFFPTADRLLLTPGCYEFTIRRR